MYKPPYILTERMSRLCGEIRQLLGRWEGLSQPVPSPRLRRENRIRTIHGSCAIEGNTLSIEQVSAVFDEVRVSGPKRDILEVENAIQAYQQIHVYNPTSEKSLLEAHKHLMKGLLPDSGTWRRGSVGVVSGKMIVHMAPPAKQVPGLMKDLFAWLREKKDLDPLIVSAIFHFEFEFIHPFSDGNGRVGRLWQHVLLVREHAIFEHMPMESVIHARQKDYYKALKESTDKGSLEAFIHYSLETILEAARPLVASLKPGKFKPQDRLEQFYKIQSQATFSRKDYLKYFPTISALTASRDLALGLQLGWLHREGERRQAMYRFLAR